MWAYLNTPDSSRIQSPMAHYEDDMPPVSRIVAGSIGEPGRRIFVLQAHYGDKTLTWVIEKEQIIALGRDIPQLLADAREEYPELGEPLVAAQPDLSLREPFHPEFRVGSLSIGYDRAHDRVVLLLVDARSEQPRPEWEFQEVLELMAAGEVPPEETDPPHTQVIYATRGQAWLLSQQADAVVAAGRPRCPACGEPIDSFGHFCLPPASQRKTGHSTLQ